MLIPKYIKGENYITFKEFCLPLHNQGVIRLKGLNKDSSKGGNPEDASNGAGKTVLVEAIQVACFDVTQRGSKKDDLVRTKNMMLDYCFEKEGIEYNIIRYRKHDKHKNKIKILENGSDITPSGSLECQKEINRILDITKDEYFSNVSLSPKTSHVLIEGKPTEKQEYIATLFDLIKYDLLQEEISIEKKASKDKLIKAEAGLEYYGDAEETLNSFPSQTEIEEISCALQTEKEDIQTSLDDIKGSINKLESEILKSQKLESKRDTLISLNTGTASLEECTAKISSLLKNKQNISDSLTLQRGQLQSLEMKNSLRKKLKQISVTEKDLKIVTNEKKVELEYKYNNLKDVLVEAVEKVKLKKKLEELEKELPEKETFNKNWKKCKSNISEVEVKISGLKEQIRGYTKIEDDKNPVCPVCKNVITKKEVVEKLKKLKKELNSNTDTLSDLLNTETLHEEIQEKFNHYSNLVTKISSLQNTDVSKIKKELEVTEKEKEYILSKYKEVTEYNNLIKQIENIKVDTESCVSEISIKIKEKEDKLDKAQEKIIKLKQAKSIFEEYENILDFSTNGSISKKIENKENLENKKNNLLKKKEDYIRKSVDHEHLLKQYATAKKSFDLKKEELKKIKELKQVNNVLDILYNFCKHTKTNKLTDISNLIIETIEEYTSILFTEDLNLGVEISPPNSIDFTYKRDGKERCSIKYMSDGEKGRLGVCLIFALKDLISQHKKQDFTILDEVDRSLDVLGKKIFSDDILPKLKNKYGTVIVISHDHHIKNDNFDKIYTVVREKGVSKLLC